MDHKAKRQTETQGKQLNAEHYNGKTLEHIGNNAGEANSREQHEMNLGDPNRVPFINKTRQ